MRRAFPRVPTEFVNAGATVINFAALTEPSVAIDQGELKSQSAMR